MKNTKMWLNLVFLFGITKILLTSGNLVPDLHWTFDVDESDKTYEVNSVNENVGRILSGTNIVPGHGRYGSVAYFDGGDSGIFINNLTSSCFLNPRLCKQGLAFSFWINWEQWGSEPFITSPCISMKHMMDKTLVAEIWNGSSSWNAFFHRSPVQDGVWNHYLFIWDKTTFSIFNDGALLLEQNITTPNRFRLLQSSASRYPTRLAIGRFSSNDTSIGKIKMYFDDFKIWERALNETEAYQVYHSGIYNPNLFKMEDITDEPQFSYLFQAPFTTMGFHILSQQHVTSLAECFKLCLKIFACKVVGYKEEVPYNVCQIRDGISGDELKSKGTEQFHYFAVDRD